MRIFPKFQAVTVQPDLCRPVQKQHCWFSHKTAQLFSRFPVEILWNTYYNFHLFVKFLSKVNINSSGLVVENRTTK